ncbi:MAG: dihydrofolate reductase family protein [Lapillicoccus sp.]
MGRLIVISFITLDGVVEDPDGSDGRAFGGWAMRHGPQGVSGDKFRLGPILQEGTLLFGRRTWEHFSTLWPTRSDAFSQAMNAADKAVVSHRTVDPATWSGSRAVDRPPAAWVREHVPTRDLVVIGSQSVVTALAGEDLVDEYRLLTFPTAVGDGHRLFTGARELELVSAERVGPAVLSVLTTRGGTVT